MKHIFLPVILAVSVIAPSSHAAQCIDLFRTSEARAEILDRELIKRASDRVLVNVIAKSADLSPVELEGVLAAFQKSMLDKGHLAWRAGYQSGLKEGGKDIQTPRLKPLPKGPEKDELLQRIGAMSDAERDAYLSANGYVVKSTEKGVEIEQNINQDPAKLFVPLHRKLNGVHERYAKLVAEFIEAKTTSKERIKRSELTALAAKVHEIWMQDASWKVQPVLEKAGIPQDKFYSLAMNEVVAASEKTLRSPLAKSLSADEIAALSQFTSFFKLGTQDKLLDEKVLFDHLETLNEMITKTTEREPQRSIQAKINGRRDSLPRHSFIKDMPILGYRITSKKFEDIPEIIRNQLGDVDKTKYTEEYLEKNIGSIFSLQTKGDGAADFYVIGKEVFQAKYRVVAVSEVKAKNEKGFNKVNAIIPEIASSSSDARLVGALKVAPVSMVKMSDIGYPVEREIRIQSPWGTQIKPAGQEAYLAWDESKAMWYMINTDSVTGFPLSYVPVGN